MTNTLILIDQIANENNFLDEAEEDEAEREKNSDSYKEFKRQFTLLWSEVMKWDKTREIHKRILSLLPEKVIKHLTKPLHMSDYFLSAFDFGRYLRKIYMTTVPKLSWV
jgi:ERCC4-type nuclease